MYANADFPPNLRWENIVVLLKACRQHRWWPGDIQPTLWQEQPKLHTEDHQPNSRWTWRPMTQQCFPTERERETTHWHLMWPNNMNTAMTQRLRYPLSLQPQTPTTSSYPPKYLRSEEKTGSRNSITCSAITSNRLAAESQKTQNYSSFRIHYTKKR